jgi:hypothetical protein
MAKQQEDYKDYIGRRNKATLRIRLTAHESNEKKVEREFTFSVDTDDVLTGQKTIAAGATVPVGGTSGYVYVIVNSTGVVIVDSGTSSTKDMLTIGLGVRGHGPSNVGQLSLYNSTAAEITVEYVLIKSSVPITF